MKSALIGYTGFVGSNLASQHKFTDLYNSKNIDDIRDKNYDLIISAGTSALRWKANLHPTADWKSIKRLIDCLKTAKAKHFILVSTIDVYPKKINVNENTPISMADLSEAYGRNRYKLELFVKKHFPKVTILRFPQLYGQNLKKGFVFDLIHDNALDFTHKDSIMQFYNLENLWSDMQRVIKSGVELVNFATPPMSAKHLAKQSLGLNFSTVTQKPPFHFDFTTVHADVFGIKGQYIQNKSDNLSELEQFIKAEKKEAQKPRLAISNLAWDLKDDKKISSLLKKYNVSGIEVAPTKIWPNPTETTKEQALKYKDFWQELGFEIIATTSLLFGHPELTIFNSKIARQKTLAYLTKMMKLTSWLGAKAMVFGSPKNRVVGDLPKSEADKIAFDFFIQVGDRAKKYDVFFGIEPNPTIYNTDFMNTTAQTVSFVKKLNHSHIKINIDTSTIAANKTNYGETLKDGLAYASHFHISEPFLKPIPAGKTNHKKVADVIKKLNYNGWLSVEMPLPKTNLSQITRTLKYVNSTYSIRPCK